MQVMAELLAHFTGRFAANLGIDLEAGPEERQKWFLAAILYGARISGQLAERTYRVFAARGWFSPEAILAQGWDNLVAILDEGGYTRYDFKTATKLLRVMASLRDKYQGDLERLAAAATGPEDLEQRLQRLAPGIGPATVNIFLRELRGIWPQADPPLAPLAHLGAIHLGLVPPGLNSRAALLRLQQEWGAQPVPGYDFTDLEAALVRLALNFCREPRKAAACPMRLVCGRTDRQTEGL